MTSKPKKRKVNLTPDEIIAAAYRVIVLHEPQHVVAARFGVNQGRVNEGTQSVRWASQNSKPLYRQIQAHKKAKKAYELATGKPQQLAFDVDMPLKPV